MNQTFKFFVHTTFRVNSKLSTRLKLLLSAGLFGVGFALLFAQDFGKKPFEVKGEITPRPSHTQLQEKRGLVQSDGKIENADQPIEMGRIRSGKTTSLIKRSSVLSYGENWTIVPQGAILHIPRHLAKRVNAERKGTLLGWKEFQKKNRGWLQLQQVSLSQARGEAILSDALVKSFQTSARVVVAICHDGPISVKDSKDQESSVLAGAGEDSGGLPEALEPARK